MTPHDRIISCVRKLPTLQLGLRWFPSLEPHVNNNQDACPFGFPPDAEEVSDCNQQVLLNALFNLNPCEAILEIGVNRNGDRSFTNVIHKHKPTSCVYVGVDTQDRSEIHAPDQNCHFLQTNSHNQLEVRAYLQQLGVHELDLILIDGWHSVNTAVNDWEYVDLLRKGGVCVMHDTNAHPGPVALFDAVDPHQFEKHRHCVHENDMGIATFVRL